VTPRDPQRARVTVKLQEGPLREKNPQKRSKPGKKRRPPKKKDEDQKWGQGRPLQTQPGQKTPKRIGEKKLRKTPRGRPRAKALLKKGGLWTQYNLPLNLWAPKIKGSNYAKEG